jgi:phospholipid transport system substrate-binding protein
MSASRVRSAVAIWRPAVRRLSTLVILGLALNVGSVAIVHGAQRGDDRGSTTGSLRPLDLVKSSVSRVLAIAQSPPGGITGGEDHRIEIRRVAHDLFAFDEMARRVMGQHSKDCLPQEQDQFVRLFADVFTQAYVRTVERYSGENVAFLGEEVTGAFAQVRSLVMTAHGCRMSIEYQLLESGSRWAVYDIVLDGASLVSTYRNLYNSSIRTSSLAQLMERMRTEKLRRQARDAGTNVRANEREPSRARAEGLLLLLGATSSARGR